MTRVVLYFTYIFVLLLLLFACKKDDGIDIDNGDSNEIIIPGSSIPVSRILGPARPGQTDLPFPNSSIHEVGLVEADLQYMWDNGNNEIMVLFGDNFNTVNGQRIAYRSNALCFSTDADISNGLTLSDVVGPGVKQIIDRQGAKGSIPTSGVTIENIHYVHYMNVKEWNEGGDWNDWATNFSEIAYSVDDGQNWILSGVKWGADSYFAQVAYFKEDGKVYMFGTKSGRLGRIRLARVNEFEILDKGSYEYWNGETWSSQELDAAPLTWMLSGEMAITYNSYYDRYFLMYLNPATRIIAFRYAESLTGEWSGEWPLMYDYRCEELYNANFYPWFNNSTDLYFVVNYSQPAYTVNLMKARVPIYTNDFNMVNDPSFEDEAVRNQRDGMSSWNIPIDIEKISDARTGSVALKLCNENENTYNPIAGQTLPVRKNTEYIATLWIRGSLDEIVNKFSTKIWALDNEGMNGRIIEESYHTINKQWTEITHEFNTGDCSLVSITCGSYGLSDLCVVVDDFKVIPKRLSNRK